MKNAIALIYILLTILTYSCKNKKNTSPSTSYIISGTISGLTENDTIIYLEESPLNRKGRELSSPIINGKFEFKGSVDEPTLVHLGITKYGFLPLFLENENYTVKGNALSYRFSEVSGGSIQKEYLEYDEYAKKYDKIVKQFTTIYNEKGSEAASEIENQLGKISEEKYYFEEKFITENRSSYVAAYLAYKNSKSSEIKKLDSLINLFDPSVQSSIYIKAMKKRVKTLRAVSIGKQAYDFKAIGIEGDSIKLSSFYSKKYLLVDFWGSWCGPCRYEIKKTLVPLYTKYKSKGFEILGVAFEFAKTNKAWFKAIKDDKMKWPQLYRTDGFGSHFGIKYGIKAVPTNVLLDENGIIIARNLHGEALKNKISELLD